MKLSYVTKAQLNMLILTEAVGCFISYSVKIQLLIVLHEQLSLKFSERIVENKKYLLSLHQRQVTH